MEGREIHTGQQGRMKIFKGMHNKNTNIDRSQ